MTANCHGQIWCTCANKNLDALIQPGTINWKGNIAKFSSTTNITELNQHFIEYVNFGGYPEVIFNKEIQNNPARFMRADIIDKVLLRDLPGLYGIKDVQELNLPGYGLHPLTGDRKGTWSIKVNANWRITFEFEKTNAVNVNLEDYH